MINIPKLSFYLLLNSILVVSKNQAKMYFLADTSIHSTFVNQICSFHNKLYLLVFL